MREVKFRAWDIRHGCMEYISDLYWFEENQVHSADDANGFIIEQYTGLKGKNEEWYQGDIISDGGKNWLIEWSDESLSWILSNPSISWTLKLGDINGRLWHKIGNIHENLELLNGN